MSGFTESALIKKLTELNDSSHSIQTTSLWLIHHRKHFNTVVKVWLREFLKNSRKKGPEYHKTFKKALVKAFEHMHGCDENIKSATERLMGIWQDRGVYAPLQIMTYKRALTLGKEPESFAQKHIEKEPEEEPAREESHEVRFHLSPQIPAGDPPEPEELIQAIQELETNTASADEKMREMIAKLPRELSDLSLIPTISNKDEGENLCIQAAKAIALLSDYNSRLHKEMECRKKLSVMMRDFLTCQEQMLSQTETLLEEFQEKLERVTKSKTELRDHMGNLPDLRTLPNVTTHGLAPLPSAENLFLQ